ncbi:copper amine oxidase N-terminal domain-containing protein [Paenibacillus eucommiae]|uniref:Copper amine oxidase N-terminal domain-containing protein n=1 Tax=Paenibacillus eucommiae TaxID=1355755 RepID=A0ABS4IS97_9BACL|nr:copper amine oxidase N-terminal domain-containing protein [Paenibacillus eucommiae]MBP1990454.1 hypothetical protein [Paenibacillus eucommiae]
MRLSKFISICTALSMLLLLLVSIVDTSTSLSSASAEPDSATSKSMTITTQEQVITRVRDLKLIPAGTEVTDVRAEGASSDQMKWSLSFAGPVKNAYGQLLHSGSVILNAADGFVLGYNEAKSKPDKDWSKEVFKEFDAKDEKVSRDEAVVIAESFIASYARKLNAAWILNPYPEPGKDTRFEDLSLRKIRFNLSHDGIPYGHTSSIYVDRITGEVANYYLSWNEDNEFPDINNVIPLETAQNLFFDKLRPVLRFYWMDQKPWLLYSLESLTLDAVKGTFKEYDEQHYDPDKWKPISLTQLKSGQGNSTSGGAVPSPAAKPAIDEQTARASAIAYLKKVYPAYADQLSERYVSLYKDNNMLYFSFERGTSGIPIVGESVDIQIDAANGKLVRIDSKLSEHVYPNKVVPAITPERAKRLLLALYDIELRYDDGQVGKKHLVYQMIPKPSTPLFYTGDVPYLDANDGAWRNFLGHVFTEPIPTASDWLSEILSSPKRITYQAAVVLDGKLLRLKDEPIIHKDSTLMPFRELFQHMGATVAWEAASRKITARTKDTLLELTLDSKTAYINGTPYTLEVPAQLVDQRTYIPARFAAEALGVKVMWEASSRLVIMNTDHTNPSSKPMTGAALKQLRLEAQQNWEEKHWQY